MAISVFPEYYIWKNAKIYFVFDSAINGYRISFVEGEEDSLYIPTTINGYEVKDINAELITDGFHSFGKITIDKGNTVFRTIDDVLYSYDGTKLILYPPGKKDKQFIVPKGVYQICEYAMSENEFLERVVFQEGLTEISMGALCCCKNIKQLSFPRSLKVIGYESFKSLDNISDVFFSGNIEEWRNVSIDEENSKLLLADMHYNLTDNLENASYSIKDNHDCNVKKNVEQIISRASIIISISNNIRKRNYATELFANLGQYLTGCEKKILADNVSNKLILANKVHQLSAVGPLLWSVGLVETLHSYEMMVDYGKVNPIVETKDIGKLVHRCVIRERKEIEKYKLWANILYWRAWNYDKNTCLGQKIINSINADLGSDIASKVLELGIIDSESDDLIINNYKVSELRSMYSFKMYSKWNYYAFQWLTSDNSWEDYE